jgi:hypothetical protein
MIIGYEERHRTIPQCVFHQPFGDLCQVALALFPSIADAVRIEREAAIAQRAVQ